MKNLLFLFALAFAVFLTGCNGKKHAELHFASEDGKVKLDLIGNRDMAADPLVTQIHLHSYDLQDQVFEVQLYVNDLTTENTKMEWSDAQHGKLTIEQTDGAKKVFDITGTASSATVVPLVIE